MRVELRTVSASWAHAVEEAALAMSISFTVLHRAWARGEVVRAPRLVWWMSGWRR